MKQLACKDMGLVCSFVATGKTDAEVKKKLNDHGMKVHADVLGKMSKGDMENMNRQMDRMLAKQK